MTPIAVDKKPNTKFKVFGSLLNENPEKPYVLSAKFYKEYKLGNVQVIVTLEPVQRNVSGRR